jgi:hypothetical protein
MTMTPRQKLLADIETFLRLTGMNEHTFGVRSCKNSHFVPRLRDDRARGPTIDIAFEVESFMREYRGERPPIKRPLRTKRNKERRKHKAEASAP